MFETTNQLFYILRGCSLSDFDFDVTHISWSIDNLDDASGLEPPFSVSPKRSEKVESNGKI